MSGFPESLLCGSSVTFCHASFGPCQLAPWHGITQTMLAPQGPPPMLSLTLTYTLSQSCLLTAFPPFPPSPPSITHHLKPCAVIQQHCFIYFSLLPFSECICPSRFADQLSPATNGGRRVTLGLRCNSRGRATWVLMITAKCLGRAGLGGHSLGQRLKVRRAKTETLPIDV